MMDKVNSDYEDSKNQKLNQEVEIFGISKISQLENEMAKWVLAILCKSFYEASIKYSPVTREEREKYFQDNNSHPNIHILKNILIPLNVYVIDKNKKKINIPFGLLEDGNFIIDDHKLDIISQSVVYYTRSESQRDSFYSFSNAIKELDLNKEDASQFFFIILCDILSARIQVFRNNKAHCTIPDIDRNQSSLNINFLKCFIDFDKLTDTELHEIYEQDYFFEEYTDYKIWCELDDLIEKIFSMHHTEIVNSVADDLTKNPHEKFEYISAKIFKLSSNRAKQLRLGRTNNLQYIDYELEIFQIAFEHSKNLLQFYQLIQMGKNQITFNGPVGQFNNHSKISNANVDMRMSDKSDEIIRIKDILEELQIANIENKSWQEALIECISEFNQYSNMDSDGKLSSIPRIDSLFQKLKNIKDLIDMGLFPVDLYTKVDVAIGIWKLVSPSFS